MRTILWSRSFVRAFKRTVKKDPRARGEIEDALRRLAQDPFDPRLATHKLKGKLSGCWACSVAFDLRILFELVKEDSGSEDAIFLLEIGTHEEVY